MKPSFAPTTNIYYCDKKAAMESALSEAVSGPRVYRCAWPFPPLMSRPCFVAGAHSDLCQGTAAGARLPPRAQSLVRAGSLAKTFLHAFCQVSFMGNKLLEISNRSN